MLIIGIAGGSGSGKTTVVNEIVKKLPEESVAILSQDAYYWDNGNLSKEEKLKINFDHPSSIEWELLIQQLDQLKNGQEIEMPTYSYVSCGRLPETIEVKPTVVMIVEGILVLTQKELRDRMDMKIFVDADPDDRLTRIIRRDIEQRGRDFKQVLRHYETYVKPMHLQFIEPTKRYADIIVPQGGQNKVAIDLLRSKVKQSIKKANKLK